MLKNSKIIQLKKRLVSLKENNAGNEPGFSESVILTTEKQLDVVLPKEFFELGTIYGFDYFTYFDFLNFINAQGVIKSTVLLRDNYNLPRDYLLLSEGDTDMILLKTISRDKSQVIWCSHEDFDNICQGKPMESNPTIFPSFAAFYEFLLDEEEKLRAEE